MQKQTKNLNGSDVNIVTVEESSPPRTPQSFIDEAQTSSEADDGYIVIMGTGLDAETEDPKVANVVYNNGIEQFQNLV